ncbi:MAG: hypothetical protein Q4A75_08525, partial [Peptostreptococcaceae bacterium]|nr:hypothetical protein [Peptostreptococcaceae bacterium]
GEQTRQERVRKITLDQVRRAEAQKRYTKKSDPQDTAPSGEKKMGPMEKRIHEKQMAAIRKQSKEE